MLLPWRFMQMLRVTVPPVWLGVKWTFTSRENHNYTYDLEPRSLDYLAAFLAAVSGRSLSETGRYLEEISGDARLKEHVRRLTLASTEKHVADKEVRFGRRMGWYALVRTMRPRLVVETGVDKGLGSVVIAAALMKNVEEGHPGKLIGIDINPCAGYLLRDPYARHGEIVFHDSLATLRNLTGEVDLFIHDSDHNPEFEAAEYAAVSSKLSPNAVILSDNAAHTDELLKFARATGRDFLYFGEKPKDHWWPGEGIGVAYRRS
jgi:hypothetical protein